MRILSAAILGPMLLGGCAGLAQDRASRQLVKQHLGKPAGDFELTAIDGGKVRLSEQRGKPVLLAFFAYG